jgi:inosine-uridine nucleoside N-ribohydrolase
VPLVIDTDTFNEADDQFAVVHSLLSPEQLDVQALYAAPFFNKLSSGPAEGMEKSYREIHRLLKEMNYPGEVPVFRGSERYLSDKETPVASDVAGDLVSRAMARREARSPLYVAALAALTDIASALLLEPEIVRRIVVVWLGGNAYHWPEPYEFNLSQDVAAAQVVFDSGVPLIHLPCRGVVSHLHTTVPELERHVAGQGKLGKYLTDAVKNFHEDHFGWSKIIWDLAVPACLLNHQWTPSQLIPCPGITDRGSWHHDRSRHQIRSIYHVNRDPVFRDLFTKLHRWETGTE